jgi:hypothetical protein
VTQSPKTAPRFVLAYHYLTTGSSEAALAQYREILKLQPGDKLSAQLAQRLGAPPTTGADVEPPNPTPATPEGQLEGGLAAEPTNHTSIALVLNADKTFRWTVTDRGEPRVLSGRHEYDKGELICSVSTEVAQTGLGRK